MKMPRARLLPLLFLLLLSTQLAHELSAQCNGDPALCNRRFDEVCYATTHNAFNYQGAFLFPNQSFDITRQLQDGVRSLMLDVYWYNNRPTVYHSSNFLGNQPLSDLLDDIKTFLDAHPNEVMSIIFESYISAAQMDAVFTQAGLLPYLHAQPQGSAWPTLADMIATNHRLVVLSDANDGQAYPWYHYVWDYAVETDYSAQSRADFSCAYNRGDSANSLFILNHFVTQASLGYGLIDSAAAVNANPYLTSRAMGCWAATGKLPNFLTVDFYEQGDVMAAKDALNAGFVGVDVQQSAKRGVIVGPNPVQHQICLHGQFIPGSQYTFSLYDQQGQLQLESRETALRKTIQISIPETLKNGLYSWRIASRNGNSSGKLTILR
jgi:hypothetical protein